MLYNKKSNNACLRRTFLVYLKTENVISSIYVSQYVQHFKKCDILYSPTHNVCYHLWF